MSDEPTIPDWAAGRACDILQIAWQSLTSGVSHKPALKEIASLLILSHEEGIAMATGKWTVGKSSMTLYNDDGSVMYHSETIP